ncbi:hypothetical protein PHIM7_118 [Sinorhizobium phage phiM7]|uniref:Uncharacterized protein n=1 Tax=Sinorhizobium phage phiM7 TaxID=1647403 RepID=A0A0F6WBN8_9CAUD|nr:hypothetical protein FDH46_gp360 [Sinorhizobium phage phiM7]AKF12664.1 hypothetical protein PHIM7_118 [Sinorhizobium phage phiM7]
MNASDFALISRGVQDQQRAEQDRKDAEQRARDERTLHAKRDQFGYENILHHLKQTAREGKTEHYLYLCSGQRVIPKWLDVIKAQIERDLIDHGFTFEYRDGKINPNEHYDFISFYAVFKIKW